VKRVALYVRVSSQGQVRDGYSLQFQEEILKEFCQRESLVIAGVYRDGGQSGSSTKRKDLLRLIEDARQSRFDMVLIFRVDRFSRDPLDLLALVRELEAKYIKLRSVTEAVDASDPAGELMLTILGAIGKFVRQNIIQNAMLGKTKRAEGGKYTGGKVPFGFAVDEAGVYRPDQTTWWNGQTVAEVAKLVFTTYIRISSLDGGGCKQVATRLNAMGVPAPHKVWSHSTVHQMLSNPVYVGDFAYNKRSHQLNKRSVVHGEDEWVIVKDAHEPIVDRHTWDTVQNLLKAKWKGGGRPADDAFKDLLTGFLRCGECEAALTPRRASKHQIHTYYTCGSRYFEKRRREGTYCESFPYLRADELQNLIWGALVETAGSEERINTIRERMNANIGPELGEAQAEVQRLEKRIKAIEQQAMTLTTAFAEGKMPDYLWQAQLERVENERKGMAERLDQARVHLAELQTQAPTQASTVEIREFLIQTLTNRTTLEERREALAILVGPRGVRVMKDGTVDFDVKIPVNAEPRILMANPSVPARPARLPRTR
jgi:site-specific DNA recombinase